MLNLALLLDFYLSQFFVRPDDKSVLIPSRFHHRISSAVRAVLAALLTLFPWVWSYLSCRETELLLRPPPEGMSTHSHQLSLSQLHFWSQQALADYSVSLLNCLYVFFLSMHAIIALSFPFSYTNESL